MLRLCRILFASAAVPTPDDISAAFRVLGLDGRNPQHATSERVRAQYLQLARLHHPDLSCGDDQKMKVVNTAYELLQRSGALSSSAAAAAAAAALRPDAQSVGEGTTKGAPQRFTRRAGLRRRRVVDDFADGDSWTMKSSLEWDTMMSAAMGPSSISEEEMRNPANHPFSHSKFFSFDDDTAIYRMIRGGATVAQVARTLEKPATFIERRLQNAQFKQRIQYVLRHEKRQDQTQLVKQRTKQFVRNFGGSEAHAARRRKEWEVTVPTCDGAPAFAAEMTLEERGRHAQLLREERRQLRVPEWTSAGVAAKVGRSYANYARFTEDGKRKRSGS